MKKFVTRSLPYIAIGLLYIVVGEFFLWQSRETCTIQKVTEIQSSTNREVYYGREILGNSLSNYKYQMFIKKQPEVLILGQSVMIKFRDFMFEPYEKDFYNTGLMARNVKDLNYVLDLIESKKVSKPKLVVLGVDMSFVLNETYLDETEWTRNYPKDRALSAKSHMKALQRIFFNPKFMEKPKLDKGFGRAGMSGLGYRNDGSYRHKKHIELYLFDSKYRDGDLLQSLKNKEGHFTEPFFYDNDKADKLLFTLKRFERLGIELILYVPPYSDTFFTEAKKNEKFSAFWSRFMGFQDELKDKGYNVISFCTPSELGLTDNYMVDADHPGEVISAIQLRNFVQSGEAKGKVINSLSFNTVEKLLESDNTIPLSFMVDSLSMEMLDNRR